MARDSDEGNPLSRERTARLLKELRALSREIQMLKAELVDAEQLDLRQQERRLHPERSRLRGGR